ncbi:MAG: hypothetical protein ABSE73_05270 [Planctomycetota bacterium]
MRLHLCGNWQPGRLVLIGSNDSILPEQQRLDHAIGDSGVLQPHYIPGGKPEESSGVLIDERDHDFLAHTVLGKHDYFISHVGPGWVRNQRNEHDSN